MAGPAATIRKLHSYVTFQLFLQNDFITDFTQCISLAWSNLHSSNVFSNDGVEWTVSDEGGIVRFDLSACLNSKGL